MACGAILGGVFLAVTGKACAHVMSDGEFGDSGLRHISMASCAGDSSLIMRGVAKFHMRFGSKRVNPYPGNLNALVGIGDYFLDLGVILQ